jgi:preprotein translocase subunit SecA
MYQYGASIKGYNKRLLEKINNNQIKEIKLELNKIENCSDLDLQKMSLQLKEYIRTKVAINLESELPRAFAILIIAIRRILKLDPFNVQIIGGVCLSQGKIIEMYTGEGKTLVATFPAYLYGLTGEGVHIVTINDYLVNRDFEQMKPLFDFLGLKLGYITHESTKEQRKTAYECDVLYSTSTEICFDYLRDNLAVKSSDQIQRKFNFVIVDEADSNLLDEAMTPLIISEEHDMNSEKYLLFNNLVTTILNDKDIILDQRTNYAYLKDSGYEKIENCLINMKLISNKNDFYDLNVQYLFYLNACVQAHYVYKKDKDYLVENNRVCIISDKTGRVMEGRRWSEGLHQAIEAKEKVKIHGESLNLATITLQNFYKLYRKLSGMTGTALTDAHEFKEIYNVETVGIPTNKPVNRTMHPDLLFCTERDKFLHIIKDVKECLRKQQPVLIGTPSVKSSEKLSMMISKEKISHQVLNAKFLRKEAAIIAQAGSPGSVTIATNMAGRGTDIILGGNPSSLLSDKKLSDKQRNKIKADFERRTELVKKAGGLFVMATERHNSRRIDNQLIGRSARQGEPGENRFYISLEDKLFEAFIEKSVIETSKVEVQPGEPIEIPFLNNIIVNTQKILERKNFELRKNLAYEDGIVNNKRIIFYRFRQKLLQTEDSEELYELMQDLHSEYYEEQLEKIENLDINRLIETYNLEDEIEKNENFISLDKNEQIEVLQELQSVKLQPTSLRDKKVERYLLLKALDEEWKDYINLLNTLRVDCYLQSYAQKDSKVAFEETVNKEFENMTRSYREKAIKYLSGFWKTALMAQQNDKDNYDGLRAKFT